VYGAGDIPEPGTIRQTSVDQPLTIGEADGAQTPRLSALARALSVAGLTITTDASIRNAIWTKLLGNVAFNPISALAQADMQMIADSERLRSLVRNVMTEAVATGRAHGIEFAMSVDQRLAMAGRLGPVKPSMLQDLEQGRPMEVEAIVGAVTELARLERIPTPTIDAVHALISGRDATLRAAVAPRG
jgi:2-dehydropantoate 2-reductase